MIGPGKGFDTDKYFVICSNILGGCRGTSGPGSINPETGCPYAMSFPPVTIPDMVRLQKMLVEHLGIERLLAVAGGSMGAMQALQWAVAYPDAVAASIPIAGTARHSPQQIAFNEVGRQAIMADLDWNEGDYYGKRPPARGLAVARMVGHITYMSDASMREKFGRRLRDQDQFEVESYLRYRGSQFVDRFDANSYLYITKAMDYFDLTAGRPSLSAAFDGVKSRFLVHQLFVRLAVSELPIARYRARFAWPQLRRRLLRSAVHLWPRRLPGERRRTDRAGPRLPGKHVPGAGLRVSESFVPKLLGRSDYAIISAIIEPKARVLDLGCGEGELLAWLAENKRVDARGVEIEGSKVRQAISRGVSVFHSDIEDALADLPDQAFDYVILSQTLQESRAPLKVLREMLRVGRQAIVAFPNFGHWSVRLAHLFTGRAPKTKLFPHDWFDSPNIHFFTVDDFESLVQ